MSKKTFLTVNELIDNIKLKSPGLDGRFILLPTLI